MSKIVIFNCYLENARKDTSFRELDNYIKSFLKVFLTFFCKKNGIHVSKKFKVIFLRKKNEFSPIPMKIISNIFHFRNSTLINSNS